MVKQTFQIRSKVWIEDTSGNVIFGLGRFKILKAIDRCGSLNAAAKELKMSYRGLWGKIKTTEKSLGAPLLIKNAGGSAGGGSTLTPLAHKLMQNFKELHDSVNREADNLFEDVFND
jgi:molybdate transport system regulatory protein